MTGPSSSTRSAGATTDEAAWRIHIPLCNALDLTQTGHLVAVEFALPVDRPPHPVEIFNGRTLCTDIQTKWHQAFGAKTFDEALRRAVNLSRLSRATGGWQRTISPGRTPAQWFGLISFQRMLRITAVGASQVQNVQGDRSAELALTLGLLAVGSTGRKEGTIVATGQIGPHFTVEHVGGIEPKLKAICVAADTGKPFPQGTHVFYPAECDRLGEVSQELVGALQNRGLVPMAVSHVQQAADALQIGHDARPLKADRLILDLWGRAGRLLHVGRWMLALAAVSALAGGLYIRQRDAVIDIAPVALTMPDQDGKPLSLQSPFHYVTFIDNQKYVEPQPFCQEGQPSTVPVRHGYATYVRLAGNWIDDLIWRAGRSGFELPALGYHPALVTLQYGAPDENRSFRVFFDQPEPGMPAWFGTAPGEVWSSRVKLDGQAGDTLTMFAIGQRWERPEGDTLTREIEEAFKTSNLKGAVHFLERRFSGRMRYICTFQTVEKG